MGKSYQISLAEIDDIEKWMALVDIVGDDFPGLDKEEYKKVLLENISAGTAVCATVRDEIVGILLFSLVNGTLSFIAVHPDFRGSGIASDMIREMIKKFPPESDICVTTFRDGDAKGEAARFLYQKIGFIEDELVEEFGYPCQKFIFRT